MDKIKFRQFVIDNLMPESKSTNPAHRRFLAFTALDELSGQLTEQQYQVDNDFDLNLIE